MLAVGVLADLLRDTRQSTVTSVTRVNIIDNILT